MSVTVSVCKKCDDSRCLIDFLHEHTDAEIEKVRCQKICKGPVIGLPVHGRMGWFKRVRGRKTLGALARLVEQDGRGDVPKPLEKRRVTKRAGRPPR